MRSRFDLQTGADLGIYDESHTEIDEDILEELLEANPKSTLIIVNQKIIVKVLLIHT